MIIFLTINRLCFPPVEFPLESSPLRGFLAKWGLRRLTLPVARQHRHYSTLKVIITIKVIFPAVRLPYLDLRQALSLQAGSTPCVNRLSACASQDFPHRNLLGPARSSHDSKFFSARTSLYKLDNRLSMNKPTDCVMVV
jgi:hypothetical protein